MPNTFSACVAFRHPAQLRVLFNPRLEKNGRRIYYTSLMAVLMGPKPIKGYEFVEKPLNEIIIYEPMAELNDKTILRYQRTFMTDPESYAATRKKYFTDGRETPQLASLLVENSDTGSPPRRTSWISAPRNFTTALTSLSKRSPPGQEDQAAKMGVQACRARTEPGVITIRDSSGILTSGQIQRKARREADGTRLT